MKRLGGAVIGFVVAATVAGVTIDRFLHLDPGRPLPRGVQRYAMARMRAALGDTPAPPRPRARALDQELLAPLVVTVFEGGRQKIRVFSGGSLAHALEEGARLLRARARTTAVGPSARIRIEVPRTRAPLLDLPALLPIELVAGVDGVGAEVGGKTAVVTPWDLIGRHLYDNEWVVNRQLEFEMGVGIDQAMSLLADDLAVDPARFARKRRLFRFRADALVEGAPGALVRERDVRHLTRETLRGAALEAARWCQAVLGASGQYRYLYDPLKDREDEDARYSLPRHCGTTYYLAQAYRYTHDPELPPAIRSALDWLVDRTVRRCGPGPRRCVRDNPVGSLGSAALAVVAMAEYRHVTNDHRYDATLRAIGTFLREMQKPNGDFEHRYSQRGQAVVPGQLLYYSGEAVLALLKLHEELGDPRDLAAAKRGLDFLTGPGWDFFFAPYYYGEEHWTCISANEAYPRIKERRYLDFCEGFARYRRRAQYRPAEASFDAAGAYGFGTFVTPHTTPTASTTEAMVSTALLARKWGRRSTVIEQQVWGGVRFLLRAQLGPAEEHLFPEPRRARGGFPGSATDLTIRIDYTQHAGSAILRASDLL